MSALPPPPPPPSSMTAMEEEEEVANDQFPTCAKILEEEPVAKDHFAACAKFLRLDVTHGITSSRGMQASLAYYLHKGDDGMAVLRCGSGKTKAALLSTLTSQDHLLLFICPLRGLARQVQDDANSIVDGSAMSSVIGGSTAFDDDDGELVADDGYDDDGAGRRGATPRGRSRCPSAQSVPASATLGLRMIRRHCRSGRGCFRGSASTSGRSRKCCTSTYSPRRRRSGGICLPALGDIKRGTSAASWWWGAPDLWRLV